jgi:hypothetical protein
VGLFVIRPCSVLELILCALKYTRALEATGCKKTNISKMPNRYFLIIKTKILNQVKASDALTNFSKFKWAFTLTAFCI